MQITTACPQCGKTYEVDGEYEGAEVQCENCGRQFTVARIAKDSGNRSGENRPKTSFAGIRIAKIMSGDRKAIAAQVIKAWWFFGNIFLSVLFLYPLSVNPYATPGAVISIILGWVFALWTLWIVYTIAMGVSELVSGRQSDEER